MRAKPFIKWVGGKRSQAERILTFFPSSFRNVYEPFVGGGAVFWALIDERERQVAVKQPMRWTGRACLSDMNKDLVSAWHAVKHSPTTLCKLLEMFPDDKATYLRVRGVRFDTPEGQPEPALARAVRFLYLNRTAFNGLWRENKKGEHNVTYDPTRAGQRDIVRADELMLAHEWLQAVGAAIRHCDYKEALLGQGGPGPGDLVYVDPPYVPLDTKDEAANFTGFTGEGFGLKEQRKLEEVCRQVAERGATVVVSQSDCRFVRRIWCEQNGWVANESSARRNVNRDGAGRGEVAELILTRPVAGETVGQESNVVCLRPVPQPDSDGQQSGGAESADRDENDNPEVE